MVVPPVSAAAPQLSPGTTRQKAASGFIMQTQEKRQLGPDLQGILLNFGDYSPRILRTCIELFLGLLQSSGILLRGGFGGAL